MCFVFEWYQRFCARNISLLLTQPNLTACCPHPISKHNCYSHIAFFIACVAIMYSSFVVDKDTTNYFLLIQLVAPLENMNTYPLVNRLPSMSLAESKSMKP